MKVKEESEKVGLKLNIQKTKIMASGPLTSWEIDGETDKMVSDFTFGVSKITADGDCTMKLKDAYSLEEGNGNSLQYSCLENPMDRGAWWATIHGVAKSWTQLSN